MKSPERGFSLLEVLVAAVIFSVISGAVVTLLYQSQRAFQTQQDFNQAGVEVLIALDQMVRSLRHAGNDPLDALSDAGVDPVEILGSGHFRVNSDITGSVDSETANPKEKAGSPDGVLDAIYEIVEYRYDTNSKNLVVDVGYGETVLAGNIEGFNVKYFDSDGFETTTDSEVIRARIRLVAATDTIDSSTGRKNLISLRSDVLLRATTYDLFSLF